MEQAPSNWARGPDSGPPTTGWSFSCRSRPKLPLLRWPRLPSRAVSLPPPPRLTPEAAAGWGIGAGLIGAAVVGTAIAANSGPYYGGYRRCAFVRQFDVYGNYIGTIRSCNYY